MRCKATGQDFNRGCGFLPDTNNSAAVNMALPLQKLLCDFHCNEYCLDSLLLGVAYQIALI